MGVDDGSGTRTLSVAQQRRLRAHKRRQASIRKRDEATQARDQSRQQEAQDKSRTANRPLSREEKVAKANQWRADRKAGKPTSDLTLDAARDKTRTLPGHMLADPTVQAKIKRAGITPALPGGKIGQTFENLADAAINAPGGLYEAGKAVALDASDTLHGKPTLKRSRKVAGAVVDSTVETVKHPLRRPGDTLLLGWGGVGAAAGTASRLGAAGSQLRKGNIGKALAAKPHEGGSLLRAPQPRARVLKHGDLEVRGLESRNKAVAAVTRKLDKRNGGQVSASRAGAELGEEIRITEAIERAPMGALAKRAKKLTQAQETAVRVVAEGKSIKSRIAFHEKQLERATGQKRRDHRYKVLLLKAAERYVDDTGPKPKLKTDFKRPALGAGVLPRKGVGPKELGATYARADKVSSGRGEGLVKTGALDEGQIEPRIHAPGRVIEGARMETQKQAQAARGVRPKKARVEQFRDYPGRSKTVTRDRTPEEAQARLDELETFIDSRVNAVYGYLKDANPSPTIGGDKRPRRVMSDADKAKTHAIGQGDYIDPSELKPIRSQAGGKETRARAEELLYKRVKASKNPSLRKIADAFDEADALRASLLRHKEGDVLGEPGAAPADLGSVTETTPGKPRRVHLREQRAEKGVKATPRLIGAEDFAGGEFRVPYGMRAQPRAHEGSPNFRGGVPRKPGSTTHGYSGGLLRSGNFRDDAVMQIAESGVEAQRYAGALRLRDRLLQSAKDEPFEGAVPIKTDDLANKPYPPQVARILTKSDEGVKLTRNEKKYLGKQYDNIVRDLGLDPSAPIDPVPGVKWIDQQLLEELHRQGAPLRALIGNRGTDVIDAVNNFSRLAIFYSKPGYVPPNVLGNALLNVNQQGASAVHNLALTGKRARAIGEDALAVVDAGMGEGVIGSLGGGNKGAPLAGTANKAAGFLGKITDVRFRRNAFFYEARQAGYRSAEDMKDLLLNPEKRQDAIEIFKRANREVIDYGRLSKKESEITRRALFVYPFMKGSTVYTGRFVKEHPVKAAATGQLAQVSMDESDRKLGPRPSYAEGLVGVGDGKAINLAGVGLHSAPAQAYRTVSDFVSGRDRSAYRLSEMLTPAASLGLAALTRRDSFTGQDLKGPGDVGKTLIDSFPQKLLYDRLTRHEDGADNRVYPYTDKDALMQFALGSVAPRPVNREALNAQAAQEDAKSLSPEKKAYRKVHAERQQFFVAAKQHMPEALEKGKLPKKLRDAFNVEAERQALYNRAVKGKHVGTVEYHRAKYEADLALLVKHGLVTPERAQEVLAASDGASLTQLKDARSAISERYYQSPGGQLHYISHARRALKDRGADLP